MSPRPSTPIRTWLALATATLLAGALTGCVPAADGSEDATATEPLSVVATMSILGDLARDIGGDHVEVTTLVPIGGDPHVFEPTPSTAAVIEDADVVLANGVGLEPWFDPLASRAGDRVTEVTEGLAGLVLDDDEGAPDPHLWMVPTVVADGYVPAIRDALAAARPAIADDLEVAAAALDAELRTLDAHLRAELDRVPAERRLLVTSHDAYMYFAEHYGWEVIGTVYGLSTEREPSAREIAELVDVVRDAGVTTVFMETTIDPGLVERVARDAGVTVGAPLYGDSVGPPGSGAEDYAGMMRANVAALVDGLESD